MKHPIRLAVLFLAAGLTTSCASAPVRDINYYCTAEVFEGLMQDAWAKWRTKGGVDKALANNELANENLRVTMTNWDNHVTGLNVASLDSELRAAVSQEDRCLYIDRAAMLILLERAKADGARVDPSRPEQIFLPQVRDIYQAALRKQGQNIHFAARGTLTKQRDVLMFEMSVLNVDTGLTQSVIARQTIPDLPDELY
ncbi:MAG: hypothetical protein ACE37K_26075 [Planctomycetota bacterium]